METIKHWLHQQGDYQTGTVLYETHGKNHLLKVMFAQGYSAFRHDRLRKELEQLLITETPEKKELPAHVDKELTGLPEANPTGKTDIYREQWVPLFQEMNMLRHSLIYTEDVEQRGRMAHRILALERRCMGWWERRDYYFRTGREQAAPDSPALSPTDLNQLHRKLMNVRSYLSKINNQLAEKPDDPKLLARKATREAERERLETLIKNA